MPLVIGCGPVGLAVIAALKLKGLHPIVAADYSPSRRVLAQKLGADVVVDPARTQLRGHHVAGERLFQGRSRTVRVAVARIPRGEVTATLTVSFSRLCACNARRAAASSATPKRTVPACSPRRTRRPTSTRP